jgi:cellulose synthase (UDP-forming)
MQRCALALAVEDTANIRLWLLRLFVLPAKTESSWLERQLLALWLQIRALLATELGVTNPSNVGLWLLRTVFIPRKADDSVIIVPLLNLGRKWLAIASRRVNSQLGEFDNTDVSYHLEQAGIRVVKLDASILLVLAAVVTVFVVLGITTPMDNWQQSLFFLVLWLTAIGFSRLQGQLPIVVLVALSLLTTFRYAYWRISDTMLFDSTANLVFGYGLLAAEAYTWLILLLSYVQTIMPLNRQAAVLPEDTASWPTVDVFIPTYNEPLKVVRTTVFAAQGMDWPKDKLNIYLLDDGKRDEFRLFAEQAGVNYIIRPDNSHAKAGNLNHALTLTSSEYIAIFDCDHVPTRAFLRLTMGWFLRDPKCALVQTPHHFFSPDPFERNLDNFGEVPNENYLFHRLVQDGNDLWNAAFFCGSCAVLKRGPLLEVGGVAVETVTEDAHTALKLHRLGYESVYINIPLAAGLATESLSGHIGQRIRWARGMVQIFRTDNPWLGKGLTIFQRICYSTAMMHFLMGIPRLVFLTAPLAYLFFDLHIIHARAETLALYVLPYLAHASIAKSKMQGPYRHSFWADVYDTALAWYITPPTTLALINPKFGKFNVTPKGGLVEEAFFDWSISKPYLLLVAVNMLGLLLGLLRLFWWNTSEIDVVLLNLFWTLLNLTLLGATLRVADEARQLRIAHRVPLKLPVILYLANGQAWHCETIDYSTGGLGIKIPAQLVVAQGDTVSIALSRGDREFNFPAEVVVSSRDSILGLSFKALSLDEERHFAQCTFARSEAWSHWHEKHELDHPMKGFIEVFEVALQGYLHLFRRIHLWRPFRTAQF